MIETLAVGLIGLLIAGGLFWLIVSVFEWFEDRFR